MEEAETLGLPGKKISLEGDKASGEPKQVDTEKPDKSDSVDYKLKFEESEQKRRSFQSSEAIAVNNAKQLQEQKVLLEGQVQTMLNENKKILEGSAEDNDEPLTKGEMNKILAKQRKDFDDQTLARDATQRQDAAKSRVLEIVGGKKDLQEVTNFANTQNSLPTDNESGSTNEIGNYYRLKTHMLEKQNEQLTNDLAANKKNIVIPDIGGNMSNQQDTREMSSMAEMFNLRRKDRGFTQ